MTMQQLPSIIEPLDRAAILTRLTSRVQELLPGWQPRQAGDSIWACVQEFANTLYLLRQYLNARGASQLIDFALELDLDQLGKLMQVDRGTLGDEAYRQAILNRPARTQPGLEDVIIANAMAASGNVTDVEVDDTTGYNLIIRILSNDFGSNVPGTPTATLISTVQAYLRDKSRTVAGILQTVQAPTITAYQVAVQVDLISGAGVTLADVRTALQAYAASIRKIGRGVNRAWFVDAAIAAGADNATATLSDGAGTAHPGDIAAVEHQAFAVYPVDVTVTSL